MSYPVTLEVCNRLCLVVGAGKVAQRKIDGLLRAGARVRVVGVDVAREVDTLAQEQKIELHQRPFAPEDLDGCWMVFATTDDGSLNDEIGRLARKHRILFLNATGEGDFALPAVLSRGHLQVAVSTDSASPSYARFMRDYLDEHLVEDHAQILSLLAEIRSKLKELYPTDTSKRQNIMRQLVLPDVVRAIQNGNLENIKTRIFECQSLPQD